MSYILETERLLLRKPTTDDAAFMLRLVNEPTWIKYIGDRNVHNLTDARNYLLNGTIKSFETLGFGFGIVLLKETGECIGMCGLVKRDYLEHVDIGFAFYREFTGKGYAFEIAGKMLAHARDVLGLEKIVAITTVDNHASIKLLHKIGLTLERKILVDGEELNLFST